MVWPRPLRTLGTQIWFLALSSGAGTCVRRVGSGGYDSEALLLLSAHGNPAGAAPYTRPTDTVTMLCTSLISYGSSDFRAGHVHNFRIYVKETLTLDRGDWGPRGPGA